MSSEDSESAENYLVEQKFLVEPNFLTELYGEEIQKKEEEDDEQTLSFEEVEYESASTVASPPYYSNPSPHGDRGLSQYRVNSSIRERPRSRSRSSSRSRSPIRGLSYHQSQPMYTSPNVVIRMYDERCNVPPAGRSEAVIDSNIIYEDEYVIPDAHYLYESERMETDESITCTYVTGAVERRLEGARGFRCRIRGGRRGLVSVRGRGRGRGRLGLGAGGRESPCALGHPLEEIWVTDDDIPMELRQMAVDVVRKRQRTMEDSLSKRSACGRNRTDEDSESESENDDFEDAIDGSRRNPPPEGHFEWSPMNTFQCREEIFKPERTGSVVHYATAYDAFRSYWDNGILKLIVKETNRNASKIASPSFQADWYPTNSHEIMCLFAFWMMLGIIRMPTIDSCFSTNYLLKTDIFRNITTLKRYRNLTRALNFVDTDKYNTASTSICGSKADIDLAYHLEPIVTHLNAKFQANYIPSQDICLGKSLGLWKGELNNQKKGLKYGIKTYELCESGTGYVWSLFVYTGKQNINLENSTMSISTAIVNNLIAPLLNKGYRLFVDNWNNCRRLARFLKRNGTDCVGSLRSCEVPPVMKHAPLKPGQFVARHSGDICALAWQDTRLVNMVSTCHGTAVGLPTVPSRPPARPLQLQPQMVLDYNKATRGLELKDRTLEPYLLERKRCSRWYIKVFKRLLNCSIFNAQILLQSSQKSSVDNMQFNLDLVNSILQNHLYHCAKSPRVAPRTNQRLPHKISHDHWPVSIPPSASRAATNRKGWMKCVVCAQVNRSTQLSRYKCMACDVPLCVENCFRLYHTS